MSETDHIRTIRTALNGLLATHGEQCHRGEWCQARIDGKEALASLSALQEERERMQADSRRLDLMEKYEAIVRRLSGHFGWTVIGWDNATGEAPQASAKTLRAAIDEALSSPGDDRGDADAAR